MTRIWLAAAMLALGSPAAGAADGTAFKVATPGTGRYEKNTWIVIWVGTFYAAAIPRQVTEGDTIEVRYEKDARQVVDHFQVRRISTGAEGLCRLHAGEGVREISDTVYVKPCTVLQP